LRYARWDVKQKPRTSARIMDRLRKKRRRRPVGLHPQRSQSHIGGCSQGNAYGMEVVFLCGGKPSGPTPKPQNTNPSKKKARGNCVEKTGKEDDG